ncbi:scoloptoxin SSD14-like [Haemaphysalis longicornis]
MPPRAAFHGKRGGGGKGRREKGRGKVKSPASASSPGTAAASGAVTPLPGQGSPQPAAGAVTPSPGQGSPQPAAGATNAPIRSRDPAPPAAVGHEGYLKERGQQPERHFSRRASTVATFSVCIFLALMVVGAAAYAYERYRFRLPPRQPRFVSSTVMGHYRGWAAVTGAKQCTNVTRKIFDRNGTVGDATVATLLCVCVALPHYCGLGGGYVGMYYSRKHLTNPKTSRFFETGDMYTNKELAETMRRIARSPERGRYFDSGEDVKAIVDELKVGGGIIEVDDFKSFQPEAVKPVTVELKTGERLFTTTPPASGAVLAFVVKVMDSFRSDGRLDDSEENVHRIVEAIKFGFGRRNDIGDPDEPETKDSVNKAVSQLVNPKLAARVARDKITDKPHDTTYYGPEHHDNDDHGTGIISVVAPDGDVICIASTINTVFGATFRSAKTGIWLNNEMNDFSSPFGSDIWNLIPSANNYIRPRRRARSSLCPVILVNSSGDVVFAGSATGGPASISALAQGKLR